MVLAMSRNVTDWTHQPTLCLLIDFEISEELHPVSLHQRPASFLWMCLCLPKAFCISTDFPKEG